MKVLAASFLVLFLLFISADVSRSQSAPANATLSGTLTDPSGAAISGAQISATPEGIDRAAATTPRVLTDASGRFSLSLAPGRYVIRVTHPSFVTHEETLDLAAGESKTLDLTLQIERLASTVVVTAQAEPIQESETTAPVTVIGRQEIERRQAVSLPDLLLFSPAIAIGRTGPEGGQTSVFLGGGNSSYTKVLVDGTAANEPGNALDFSNFTLDNIDKVEIVRGAESALYGTDAVSGVIQVFTHRGTTRIPAFTLFGEGGRFSTGRGGAQMSGLLGRFDYSTAASYFQTDGPGINDSFLNRTLSGNFGWRFSDTHQLRLSLRNNTSDAGIPGQILFEPPDPDQHAALHFFSANARWNFTSGKHWRHEISGAQSYNREFIADPVKDSPSDFTYESINHYNRAGLLAQSSYLLPTFGATLGFQYEVENASISALNGRHVRRNNKGGFLDLRLEPLSRLSLNLGLRAEANATFGTRVVPRIGASFALRRATAFWGDTRFRAFYGQGIKEPRFDQSFGTSPCTPGNPSLKPEQSQTWSAGIEQKLASDRVRASVEYFNNRFSNVVSFAFTPLPKGCGFSGNFFNTDLARARGTNITVEAQALRWLNVAGNYTYDDSRVLKSLNPFMDPALVVGSRLIRRPPHSGALILNANVRRVNLNLAGYFSGSRADSDFRSFLFQNTCFGPCLTRNPGYARFDLATAYRFDRGLSFYARITNLFDRRYQDVLGYPALGRDFRLGMKYTFVGRE
jgi:vitamin B12 transporter